MILRRLRLRRFLGIHDGSYEFAPGINVIVGPNEAGKSTLRTAIRTVVYGNPATTSSGKRDEFRSWGAQEPPELILEFEVDERVFTLTKDFGRRTVVLADGTGRMWEQHKVVQERLAAVLGLPTEELFEATAQIAQAELERIHVDSVARELGRIISGGGEDVAVAVRRLDQRVRVMEKGNKGQPIKEPGELRALDDRVAAVRADHRRLTASVAEAERERVERDETLAMLKRLGDEFAANRALLELNRRILQEEEHLQARKREEAMLEERVKNIEENLSKLDAIDKALETTTATGVPGEDAVSFVRSQQGRIVGLEAQIQRLGKALNESPGEVTTGARTWRMALIVAGGLAGLVGLLSTLLARSSAGVVLAVFGSGAALAGLWSLHRMAEARRLWTIRLEERQRHLAELEEEASQARMELAERLGELGSASVKEVEDRFEQYHGLVRDRSQVAKFLSELRGGSSDEVIAEQWKTVRRDIFAIEERLRAPEIADKRLTPLQVQALERDVERLDHGVAKLEERERRLSWELERLATDTEALPVVEEQWQEAEDALQAVRHRHAVYRAALEGLEEARRLAEVPVRKVMEDRACEYLQTLSGGRYTHLQVDALGVRVWADQADGWVEAKEPSLSRGTVDLVYLSARLALVKVLARAKQPPLLFDDPFVTFDEDRRAASAELLKRLSQTYQIFLFTCSRYYDSYADRLIDLSAQAEVESRVLEPQRASIPSVGPLWDRLP